MIFSLVIAYFGSLRLHRIAPFLSKFQNIKMLPRTPLARVWLRILTVLPMHMLCNLFLDNKLIFIRKLKNADQIYTYLMKLKYTSVLGLIGIVDNCITKKTKTFSLSIKKSSFSCWKKSAPAPPPPPNQKNKWSVSN